MDKNDRQAIANMLVAMTLSSMQHEAHMIASSQKGSLGWMQHQANAQRLKQALERITKQYNLHQ